VHPCDLLMVSAADLICLMFPLPCSVAIVVHRELQHTTGMMPLPSTLDAAHDVSTADLSNVPSSSLLHVWLASSQWLRTKRLTNDPRETMALCHAESVKRLSLLRGLRKGVQGAWPLFREL
jgi:hypothetical protein